MEYTNKDRDVLRQIKRLLALALAQPEGEQASYVAGREDVSAAIRQEVLRLLETRDAVPGPLAAGTLAALLAGAESAERPEVGEILGERYRVERVLAAGGSSQVVEATDLRLAGARVAIKILQGGAGRRCGSGYGGRFGRLRRFRIPGFADWWMRGCGGSGTPMWCSSSGRGRVYGSGWRGGGWRSGRR